MPEKIPITIEIVYTKMQYFLAKQSENQIYPDAEDAQTLRIDLYRRTKNETCKKEYPQLMEFTTNQKENRPIEDRWATVYNKFLPLTINNNELCIIHF